MHTLNTLCSKEVHNIIIVFLINIIMINKKYLLKYIDIQGQIFDTKKNINFLHVYHFYKYHYFLTILCTSLANLMQINRKKSFFFNWNYFIENVVTTFITTFIKIRNYFVTFIFYHTIYTEMKTATVYNSCFKMQRIRVQIARKSSGYCIFATLNRWIKYIQIDK